MIRMHADELDIDSALVRRLLATQFPHWAGEAIQPVLSAGTDNALFRLGRDKVVRLPRIHWAAGQPGWEQQWLPRLAPRVPLPIPVPLALGEPAAGYPFNWSIGPWLPGKSAAVAQPVDLADLATDLASFVVALHRIETTDGPPRPDRGGRGAPLAERHAEVRAALRDLGGLIDTTAAAAAWESALAAPEWEGAPVWLHGDLQPGNLLVRRGRLAAVIDWGALAVGDPACDLMPAWTMFAGESRAAFRDATRADDTTWARARGWALSVALIALPYYLHTNLVQVTLSRRAIAEVLAEAQPH